MLKMRYTSYLLFVWFRNQNIKKYCYELFIKGHLFCKQCLHELQFMKTRSSSPNLFKLARAYISCQFMKTRSLCRLGLPNEWT